MAARLPATSGHTPARRYIARPAVTKLRCCGNQRTTRRIHLAKHRARTVRVSAHDSSIES